MSDNYISPLVTRKIENHFSSEPGWSSGMTFVFLLSGSLDMQVNTHFYQLRPYDFLFFKPYDIYYATHPEQEYQAVVITMERALITNACPGLDDIRFELRLIRYSEEDSVYLSICTDLAGILKAADKTKEVNQLNCIGACSHLLSFLIKNYGSAHTVSARKDVDYARERAVSILRYISENYAEHITLNSIASHTGLHPQYFSVFFKKYFHANFSDYLNRYRVAQSLHALKNTDESILSIAIANGFNNHKTYSAAFQKSYDMMPRDYRKKFRAENADTENTDSYDDEVQTLEFFNLFSSESVFMPDSGSLSGKSVNIKYRDSDNEEPLRNNMLHAVSIGRALTCLRSDIQQQLKAAKEDLNLEYVRIRDIFSDSLFFYFEDADKNPVFNWVAIDTIFDFFRSIDVRPYIELGYTPSPLASKKQYAAWQYHPNVSMPKSYPAWANLITRFFEHIIERYGLEEVRKWYFEFWTNPNLKLEKGYWYESREEFFRFYAVTYFAVKSVDSQLILGSPNFSYPAGLGWYESFLIFAKENGIKPDFISHHAYSIGDGQSEKNESILNLNAENVYHALTPEKEYLAMQIRALKEISESRGFGDLDIIISDWNVSYLPQDYSRDTCFMAAFMLHSFTRAMGQVKCLCVWSLSDIHEEFFYHDTMFHGGPGLIDYAGIPKASYYALSFVGSLSKEIIRAEDNYILTKNGAGYQLILYNMAFYDSAYRTPDLSAITYSQRYNIYDDVRTMNFHIALNIEPGRYNITERIINRESGSSYDIWQKMGRPEKIMGHLADYLKSKCIPDVYMETIAADPELLLDISVEPHGVTYISIQPVK